MLTKHRLMMSAFVALALALSFTSGWAVNESYCDPVDCMMVCDPSDCPSDCPPECMAVCEEACPRPCDVACAVDCAAVGTGASISMIDPAGNAPYRLFAGQSAEIVK